MQTAHKEGGHMGPPLEKSVVSGHMDMTPRTSHCLKIHYRVDLIG